MQDLNWLLRTGKIICKKKTLSDKKMQRGFTATIDKFVNSRQGGESREGSEENTRASYSPFYIEVTFSWLLSIPSVFNAASGDDEGKENLVRYKGRFMSRQKICILNNLAKANLKCPIEKKTFENGEPETKRVTRSLMVSYN